MTTFEEFNRFSAPNMTAEQHFDSEPKTKIHTFLPVAALSIIAHVAAVGVYTIRSENHPLEFEPASHTTLSFNLTAAAPSKTLPLPESEPAKPPEPKHEPTPRANTAPIPKKETVSHVEAQQDAHVFSIEEDARWAIAAEEELDDVQPEPVQQALPPPTETPTQPEVSETVDAQPVETPDLLSPVEPITPLEPSSESSSSFNSIEPLGQPTPAIPNQPSLHHQYQLDLQNFIAAHATYPKLAQNRGLQGTVELTLKFDGDGRLEHIEIAESSGHSLLDKAATKSVKKALKRMTDPTRHSQTFTVQVQYQLI